MAVTKWPLPNDRYKLAVTKWSLRNGRYQMAVTKYEVTYLHFILIFTAPKSLISFVFIVIQFFEKAIHRGKL